eukprot:scaffold9406_cov149-Isochrysis_galbana.AAC.4
MLHYSHTNAHTSVSATTLAAAKRRAVHRMLLAREAAGRVPVARGHAVCAGSFLRLGTSRKGWRSRGSY